MDLELLREYFPKGTNGELRFKNELICYTIELPWRENKRCVSCIPEGKYSLIKRFHVKYGWHLLLQNVPRRSYILVHAAYDAKKELKGCIATVTKNTGEGMGIYPKKALLKLMSLIPDQTTNETIYLSIKKKTDEHPTTYTGTNA
jgi:Family of unknown function (DUF5675)